MEIQIGLKNKKSFDFSREIVNGKWHLNQFEEDLLFIITAQIEKDDKEFKEYVFTKADLEKISGKQINSKQLKKNILNMMEAIISVETEHGWLVFPWFDYVEYSSKDNTITCAFSTKLRPYLLELKQFIRSELKYILKLEGKYSRRIYLMLKEQFKFGKRHFNVEKLQELLGVPKSLKNYADFKRKVLIQSIKEINAKTDLEIKNLSNDPDKPKWLEEKKLGRKVIEVIVHFKKNSADFDAFIENIRTLHVNVDLYKINNRILRCSSTGLLYYADNPNEHINKKDALRYWNIMFENRDKLIFIQKELEEMKQKLLEQYKLTA